MQFSCFLVLPGSAKAGWIKMALGMEVGLGPSHIVLDGDPAPPPQKGGRAPQFSAHFCCGQMAGWMKTPHSTEVDLGQGHIVLASPRKGHSSRLFSGPVYCGHGCPSQLLLSSCVNTIIWRQRCQFEVNKQILIRTTGRFKNALYITS